MKPAAVYDYRKLAKRRLPKFLFEYMDGGAYSEITLNRNRADLERIALRQRVARDVSKIDMTTSLFGNEYAIPVALAPIGIAGMNARRGEVQAVRAAENRNVPFCLSTLSACSIEEVAAAASRPFWLQLYMLRDRAFMRDLLKKARAAGCSLLVFTVDMPVAGSRYRDRRSGLTGDAGIFGAMRRMWQAMTKPRWAWDVGVRGRPHELGNVVPLLGGKTGLEDFFAWMSNNFDPAASWDDLAFIRGEWDGPIVVKGIMDTQDARIACDSGVDGIVVSNHGGRQLDGVPSTANALSMIAGEVGDETTVMVDGGIYSGLDVIRMLALGADAVLIGRAWAYALAGRGREGVEHILQLIEDEMRVAMSLTGQTQIKAIDRDILVNAN